jgi:hypothetical protein
MWWTASILSAEWREQASSVVILSKRFLRSEESVQAARCVVALLLRKAATQQSRVWLASLAN